jgi:hypothetical protein
MLGIHTEHAKAIGGFDMAFNCRHAGEDQNLGWRLDGMRVFIHEPPYSWHPEEREPWGDLGYTNTCDSHNLDKIEIEGHAFVKCTKCPYRKFDDQKDKLFARDRPIISYDHSKMFTREEYVSAS